MASVNDVAQYVLNRIGYTSTMKLQKLVFYSQAYSLASTGKPLFEDRIEAWANGPVVPSLFSEHRGRYVIGPEDLTSQGPSNLTIADIVCIDHVVSSLGNKTGAELSCLTHSEEPWRAARGNLPNGARSNNQISRESIRSFYSSGKARSNPAFC